MAKESGSDFTFNGQFEIENGTAGALVFRAASDMSSYLVANYDANEKIVKLWSTHGELARIVRIDVALNNIVLNIKAKARDITITLNGQNAIQYTLAENEPLSGRFGVNVFSATVAFKSLSLIEDEQNVNYTSGELEIDLGIAQYVSAIYNLTTGNTRLEPGYYRQTSESLFIKEEYFALLENGLYRLKVVGSLSTIQVNVGVNMTRQLVIDDVVVDAGLNVNVYVGNTDITSVVVNETTLDESQYSVHDYVLTIDASCFQEGSNEVVVNNTVSFNVTVNSVLEPVEPKQSKSGCGGNIVTTSVILSSLSLALVITLIARKKRETL